MNKTSKIVAEFMEGRVPIEGNDQQANRTQAQDWNSATSGLLDVRKVAQNDRGQQFDNLFHHIDEELLTNSFKQLKRQSAPGCDGVTWYDYAKDLHQNIRRLCVQLKTGQYKPLPARRVLIPKEDGTERPLRIICMKDKIVQQAVVLLLTQIYEVDFLVLSYGFRPGKGQHDALDSLHYGIMKRKVNWVLDLDITKFFDSVEHGWLIQFIQHRVQDKRIIRLITQWLKIGALDSHGHRVKAQIGTP